MLAIFTKFQASLRLEQRGRHMYLFAGYRTSIHTQHDVRNRSQQVPVHQSSSLLHSIHHQLTLLSQLPGLLLSMHAFHPPLTKPKIMEPIFTHSKTKNSAYSEFQSIFESSPQRLMGQARLQNIVIMIYATRNPHPCFEQLSKYKKINPQDKLSKIKSFCS